MFNRVRKVEKEMTAPSESRKTFNRIFFVGTDGTPIHDMLLPATPGGGSIFPVQGDEIVIDNTQKVYVVTRVITDYFEGHVIAQIEG